MTKSDRQVTERTRQNNYILDGKATTYLTGKALRDAEGITYQAGFSQDI